MAVQSETNPEMIAGVERELGRISGPKAGPTLICVGGLHGNEPAGVHALHRVLESLSERGAHFRGDLVALAGNLGALAEGKRYLSWDLNRSWTVERLEAALPSASTAHGEDREQADLERALDEVVADARGPVFLLDLHTTSGPGFPFTAVMDSPATRGFALRLPVPLVLGFGELVDGTFFGYLTRRGITSMVFEGGQHEDDVSVETSQAAIWLALAEVGLIREGEFPEIPEARRTLQAMAGGLPEVLKITYRHPVAPGDGFRMEPGFENFQSVSTGQLLARDAGGEIRAVEGGRLLLPLYQAQGDDGFFIIQEVELPA